MFGLNTIYNYFFGIKTVENLPPPHVQQETKAQTKEIVHEDYPNNGFDQWNTLPQELVQQVFSHVHTRDRIQGRSICRAWFKALDFDCLSLPQIIDVRTVKEMLPTKNPKLARTYYRGFRAVIDLVGGLEKFRELPELTFNGRLDGLTGRDLPAALVRIRHNETFAIAFRHVSTYPLSIVGCVGLLGPKWEANYNGGWYITFGGGFPEIKMNRDLSPYNLEPELEKKMTQNIQNPMQTLKKLFHSPVYNKENSKCMGVEIFVKGKKYHIALYDFE